MHSSKLARKLIKVKNACNHGNYTSAPLAAHETRKQVPNDNAREADAHHKATVGLQPHAKFNLCAGITSRSTLFHGGGGIKGGTVCTTAEIMDCK